MIEVISSFRGENAFLSNYDTAPFKWRGQMFKSGEHAFSYAKTWHTKPLSADVKLYKQREILDAPGPNQAKGYGRRLPLDVESWDARKVHYMREIVHAKFQGVKGYAGKLINTGASPLVEGNDWNDKFWGKCRQADGRVVGLNMLGTILTEERGYWLWYRHAGIDVLSSPLTLEQAERTADYA